MLHGGALRCCRRLAGRSFGRASSHSAGKMPGIWLARRTDLASAQTRLFHSRASVWSAATCRRCLPRAQANSLRISPVPRAKAPTSWRTPNAAATAKPAHSLHTCRVRNTLNTYDAGSTLTRYAAGCRPLRQGAGAFTAIPTELGIVEMELSHGCSGAFHTLNGF